LFKLNNDKFLKTKSPKNKRPKVKSSAARLSIAESASQSLSATKKISSSGR
jgi:hypothetical protein